MELQHAAHLPLVSLALFFLFVEGVAEHREHGAVQPRRGLDHFGEVFFLALFVEVTEVLLGMLRVLGQVEIVPVVDSFDFLPAEGEVELNVEGPLGIVRQLVRAVFVQPPLRGVDAEQIIEVLRCWSQYSNHFSSSSGGTKNCISICSNSRERNVKRWVVTSLRNALPV